MSTDVEIEKFRNGDGFTLVSDSQGHRGGFVALVEDGEAADGFRQLAVDFDRAVSVLQVRCDCGWRSSRFNAPPGTRWVLSGVAIAPLYLKDATAFLDRLWRWHLREPLVDGN